MPSCLPGAFLVPRRLSIGPFLPSWLSGASQAVQLVLSCLPGASQAVQLVPSCLSGASQAIQLVLSCLPGASQAVQLALSCLPGAFVPPFAPAVVASLRRDLRLAIRDLNNLLAYGVELECNVASLFDAWRHRRGHLYKAPS